MEPAVVKFSNLYPDYQWKEYYSLFNDFGPILKLYIHPTGNFGSVHFSNFEDAHAAKKKLNGTPPLFLDIAEPVPLDSAQLSSASGSTVSFKQTPSNMYNRRRVNRYIDDDFETAPSSDQYVDIYGRLVDTMESETGEVYVSLTELQKSGFELYLRQDFPNPSELPPFKPRLLQYHQMYLKMKSKKFIIATSQKHSQEKINAILKEIEDEYRSLFECEPVVVDKEIRSITITSNVTTPQTNPQNKNRARGKSQERRQFNDNEHKGFSNNTSSSTNNWNKHTGRDNSSTNTNSYQSRRSSNDSKNQTARDSPSTNNYQSRRSFNDSKNQTGRDSPNSYQSRRFSNDSKNQTGRDSPNSYQSQRSSNDSKNHAERNSPNTNNYQPRQSPTEGSLSGHNKVYNDKPENRMQTQGDSPGSFSKQSPGDKLELDIAQKVKIVHLETESIAWVQLSSNENLLNDIMLQTIEESCTADVIQPAIGKICSAFYSNIWFRTLIISTCPVTVHFIDFGSKYKGITEFRELSLELCNIPRQAIRVCMEFGSNEILKMCMKITIVPIMQEEDGTYIASVQKPLPEKVAIPQKRKVSFSGEVESEIHTSTPNTSVNKSVLRRPNTPIETTNTEINSSIPKPIVEVTNDDSQIINKPVSRKVVIDTKTDSGYFECLEVISENTFVGVAMPAAFIEEVSMLDLITNDCKPDPTFKPNLGDTVALFKEDAEAYVRGVVINNLNKQYTCALIDYGVTLSVPRVCPLPDKYMNIPEFACLCTADPATIQKITKGTEHVMEIKSPSQITLTLKDGEVVVVTGCRWDPFETSPLAIKVNKVIAKESIEDKSVKVNQVVAKESNEDKSVKAEEKLYKTLLKSYQLNQSDIVILISEIEGSLIVRTRECDITLKDINQELSNYKGKTFTEQPEAKELVVCPFSDGALYRGAVVSVKGPNALVEYLDYGNTDIVPIKELQMISKKLANLPITCIKIMLKGFVKSKFSLAALNYLEECAKKREKFTVVSENDDQTYDLLFRDNNSLSEKLIGMNKPSTPSNPKTPEAVRLPQIPSSSSTPVRSSSPVVAPAKIASPIVAPAKTASPVVASSKTDSLVMLTDIPRCKLNVGDNEVMCLFAGDVAEGTASFCIADAEKVGEKMLELTDKINAQVAKDSTPYRPKQFEVCLASFEGDWYRAAFIKGFEENYGMFYLDYGNTKTVTAKDIRKMPKELGEIECLSALCILEGVKKDDEPIKEPLLSKLVSSVSENEIYSIRVVKDENSCYVITIPSLFKEWQKEGLLH